MINYNEKKEDLQINFDWEKPIKEIKDNSFSYISLACKKCPNHPSNGGSGICHCILGAPVIN